MPCPYKGVEGVGEKRREQSTSSNQQQKMSTHIFLFKWQTYIMEIFGFLLLNNAILTMSIYLYDPGSNPNNLLLPLHFSEIENITYSSILLCLLSFAIAIYQVSYLAWLSSLAQISNLGSSSFFISPNAMLPDVIDCDEQNYGVRREAIFFGTRGFLQNVSQGIGVLLAGLILILGKTPTQPWEVQSACPLAGLFALTATWSFVFYPIDE